MGLNFSCSLLDFIAEIIILLFLKTGYAEFVDI